MPILLATLAAIVAFVVLAAILLLAALPLLQSLSAVMPRRPVAPVTRPPRPRVAILMPAHDEAYGIAAALASLLPQLAADDRLIVIADNCGDDTAAIATGMGATVLERVDPVRRGKGYALAHGFAALAADPPAVVLMFDADCDAAADCVTLLTEAALACGRPVQARYLLRAADDGVRARLSEFALRLRNWARPLGMLRIGLPCQLTGSGMAFAYPILADAALASGHLTEDLQLGLQFAERGLAPRFCPDARVDSRLAPDAAAATTQRTRWAHGHLAIIASQVPRLVVAAFARRDVALLMLAWDLAVPPFALFIVVEAIACAVGGGVLAFGGPAWPFAMALAAFAMTAATMVVVQRAFAHDLIRLAEIAFDVPLYLVSKVPMYLRVLWRRQVEWVRTKRDAG